jgi:cell wall-associated NlpC family hydrolase
MQRILSFCSFLLLACATPAHASEPAGDGQANEVALYAMSLADTPYRYGGSSRDDGFDCSGFVRYVFENVLGVSLPRTSAEMGDTGEALAGGELRPGDLVFFNTRRRPFSHVGIYLGEDRFVHAPGNGKAIMVVNMQEKYWRTRYNGARRFTSANQQ